jgi:cephalosporin hydroxylase
MITIIDEEAGEVIVSDKGQERRYLLSTADGFAAVSRAWLRAGWDARYVYGFTWMGRPIIQLPEDIVRIQELIFRIKPDVIIETGIAHGGSMVLYASLQEAMNKGHVIGIDIEIRPDNRAALETHFLRHRMTLVEGNSVDPEIIERVTSMIKPGETVLVMLDSNHSKEHVLAELRNYAPLVTVGSFIVVCDGIMEMLVGAPRTKADWEWNNPRRAISEFVAEDTRFIVHEPNWPFNESAARNRVTYWPDAFIQRIAP